MKEHRTPLRHETAMNRNGDRVKIVSDANYSEDWLLNNEDTNIERTET